MATKTYRVEGMHCPNCSMRLEGLEDTLAGVQRVEASYKMGTMIVEFDDSVVDEEKIKTAIEELGYIVLSTDF